MHFCILLKFERNQISSPMCSCMEDEQTAFHILTSCPLVDHMVHDVIKESILRCNNLCSVNDVVADTITIMNCSRDYKFIKACLEIIRSDKLNLPVKFNISKKCKEFGPNHMTMLEH